MLCSASSCCWRRTKTSLSSGSRCQEWNSNCFSSKNFYQRNWSQPFALLYSHWIWIVIDRTWLVPTPSSLLTATSASPTGKCFSQQSLCCLNPGHLYHQIFILISGVTSSSKSLICQTNWPWARSCSVGHLVLAHVQCPVLILAHAHCPVYFYVLLFCAHRGCLKWFHIGTSSIILDLIQT